MNKRKRSDSLESDTLVTVITMPSPPPHSPSPSTPAPRTQVHLSSPEITAKYSPTLIKRMQTDECFRCHEIGHWSLDCPLRLNSPNNNSNNKRLSSSSISESLLGQRKIYCRCGHGFCVVKESQSVKNPGRKYYKCPIERGKPCFDYVKFCDLPIHESFFQPPPYKYPECECEAGVCEKVKDPCVFGKVWFVCPIPKGHGKCDYKVSEDELLHNNNRSIIPIQQSSQEHHDLGEQSVDHSKRMRMMDSIETLTTLELPEGDNTNTPEVTPATPEVTTPSRRVSFTEFQVDNDLQEVVNSMPLDALEREAFLYQSTRRISCRQNLFGNSSFPDDPFADASFGRCPRSWLGRLVFLCPAQSLKFPATQPIFCFVPTQAISSDNHNKQLAITNSSGNAPPPSNGCRTEVSGDVLAHTEVPRDAIVNPSQSQGSQRKPKSKAERGREMALVLQKGLLNDLENMDPHDKESMRMAAEDSFVLLDGLSVDYKLFSEHVRDYINHATSIADIDKSMENSLTFEECKLRLESEIARFSQLQEDCATTEALLKESARRKQCLHEEVSNLEAMLHERQKQLNSCEVENKNIETQLVDLKKRMEEANIALNGRTQEAEIAKKLNEERETKQMAAKVALEKAKLELIIN